MKLLIMQRMMSVISSQQLSGFGHIAERQLSWNSKACLAPRLTASPWYPHPNRFSRTIKQGIPFGLFSALQLRNNKSMMVGAFTVLVELAVLYDTFQCTANSLPSLGNCGCAFTWHCSAGCVGYADVLICCAIEIDIQWCWILNVYDAGDAIRDWHVVPRTFAVIIEWDGWDQLMTEGVEVMLFLVCGESTALVGTCEFAVAFELIPIVVDFLSLHLCCE